METNSSIDLAIRLSKAFGSNPDVLLKVPHFKAASDRYRPGPNYGAGTRARPWLASCSSGYADQSAFKQPY